MYKHSICLKKTHKISFIPTMGALHNGHLSLIEKAYYNNKNSKIIVSIFANPSQFTNFEDFAKYPDTIDSDIKKLKEFEISKNIQIDCVFIPEKNNDFYSNKKYPQLQKFNINKSEIILPQFFSESEGKTRKGHFEGVFQVLFRLFYIISPDYSVFGQKDFQQTLLVQYLQKQYFPHLEIIIADICREKSGLAMSSRNKRLSAENKNKAKILYQALQTKKIETIRTILESEKLIEKIHYIEIRNTTTFELMDKKVMNEVSVILLSVQFAGIHLIDNILI